jgi:quercetin dioxygenase-like cupin family protein
MLWRTVLRGLGVAVLVSVAVPFHGTAQTPQEAPRRPTGLTAARLIDNERVSVSKVTIAAGGDDGSLHASKQDTVLIQATAGQIEVQIGESKTVAREEAGKVWWLPKDVPHRVANVGDKPFDLISVNLK